MEELKVLLTGLITILIVGMLSFYYFIPFNQIELSLITGENEIVNPSFFLNVSEDREFKEEYFEMQFYPNMRYSDYKISYKIDEEKCTLQKIYDSKRAFEIISNKTMLEFYSVNFDAEISITCSDEVKLSGDFFVAGEGGPVNVTKTDYFYVIHQGTVLLLRDSKCSKPNIAIHEILHALGFDHSENPKNIMYPSTRCDQTMGEEIPFLINQIYSIESLPNLNIENPEAIIKGRYLDLNFSLVNHGLKIAKESTLKIYADDNLIKEEEINPLDVGEGIRLFFRNIAIGFNVKEIKVEIDADYEELDKNNNKIKLEMKK